MIQKGSIVAIKPLGISPAPLFVKWMPRDDEKTPYTVREVVDFEDGMGVLLEEGIIGFFIDDLEIGISINYIIELLPPKDISEEIQEIIEQYNLVEI